MKKILYILLTLLIIIGGAGYYLFNNLEWIVKRVVNKYGSEVTGTEVNLSGFDLSLTDGQGTIKKITIANPKGYSTPYLFDMEEITVKVDIKSLTSDTIVVEKIDIKKPIITYEMMSLTKNNISDIQKNIANYTAKSANKPTEAKPEAKNSEPGKKVIIKKITVNGGELSALTKIANQENKLAVKLPPIEIKGIGQGKSKTVAESIADVINQILATASTTVVNNQLGNVKALAQEHIDITKKQADGLVGSAKDTVKSIGGLFGGSDK